MCKDYKPGKAYMDLVGRCVTVTATPAAGYEYIGWGDCRDNQVERFNHYEAGHHKSLVGSSWADTNNLVVDESVVSHGVDVCQVAGLRGEWLLHSPLLQQEAAVVADDGPGDIRGNHDVKDCFSCRSESSNISL